MCAAASGESEWFPDSEGQFVPWWGGVARKLLCQLGPTPKHVAFILDGNRRFARKDNLGSVIQGHAAGFERVTQVLDWCRELDVREVTLYAFSIENFKRTQDEVQGLLHMAEEKFLKLLADRGKLEQKRVCFRFFGRRHLLSHAMQRLMAEIEEFTKHFERAFVNVCLAYTSTAEMTDAMNDIRRGVAAGFIQEDDIDEDLISGCLETRNSLPVDMLVRTSGEHRLSDFLLWQCDNCYIHFEEVLWPEFEFHHLMKAMFGYQRNRAQISTIQATVTPAEKVRSEGAEKFLQWLENERVAERQKLMRT